MSHMNLDRLNYALAKQVPSMSRGFFIATDFGDIVVPPGWLADRMREHTERALQCEQMHLQREGKA